MSPLRLAIDPSADMPHRQLTNLEMSSFAPLSSITTPENSSCGMMSIGAMAMARSGLLNTDDTSSWIATPTTEVDIVGLLRMTIGALHIEASSLAFGTLLDHEVRRLRAVRYRHHHHRAH